MRGHMPDCLPQVNRENTATWLVMEPSELAGEIALAMNEYNA